MKKFCWVVLFLLFSVILSNSISFSQQAKKLSLPDCIEIALENNTSIVSAQSYSKMAEAGLKSAWGNFMPTIDSYARWQKQSKDQYNIRFDELVISKESYYYQISLSQPIFTGFRNYFNLKRNKADDEYYQNNLRWTKQLIVLEVKLRYYNVLKAIQLLKIAEEALKTSEEELSRIDAMEKIGASSRAEVYQQKVRVGENKLVVIEARNGLMNAKTDLNHVLGIDITSPIELIAESTDVSVEIQKTNLEGAIEEAFQKRLDYKSFQNRLDKSNANVRIQKSAYYPGLSLSANYNWWDVQFPEKKRDITEFDSYSFGLNLSMNIFNGFQTKAGVNSAKAEVVAAEADLEQAKRQVTLDVKKALLELEKAAENIEVTGENVISAEEDYRLASERYRIGAGTLLDQNTAQTSLTRARVNRIRAIYDYKYAGAVLDLAMGRVTW